MDSLCVLFVPALEKYTSNLLPRIAVDYNIPAYELVNKYLTRPEELLKPKKPKVPKDPNAPPKAPKAAKVPLEDRPMCPSLTGKKTPCKKMTTPVSAPKIEAKTDVKATAPVKVEMPTLPPMDKTERVKRLKEHLTLSKVNHEDQVMKLATLKDAHTYCVIHGVSAQQYGPLLERFIRTKFNYIKNKAEDCTGDCSKDGKNSEVKVSLGGATHTKFNFVQIRPSHDCETYILTAYNLSSDNVESEGELYIFKVPKEEIKKIVVSFGGYAHGTIKEHGKITIESLNDKKSTKEYALRPTINDACWKALMPFKIPESGL